MRKSFIAVTVAACAFICGVIGALASSPIPYIANSALERLEYSLFDTDFQTGAPITWNHPKRRDFLISPSRRRYEDVLVGGGRCWPAAGKVICGVADVKRGLVAYTHGGCCTSNGIAADGDAASLHLPEEDLSGIHTVAGLHIGSTPSDVERALGKPTIAHDRRSGRTEYLYESPVAHSCAATWIVFLFDLHDRIIGIEDAAGC